MLSVVAVHGVSGTLQEVRGYGHRLAQSMDAVLSGLTHARPRVVEAVWADVAQRYVSREVIEAATVSLAGAVAGPLGAAAAAALQALGCAPLSTALDYAVDVLLYEHDDIRWHIMERVKRVILDHAPCVLVGHSLGSVIARDVLTEWDELLPDLSGAVRGLVTMGSPLGIDVPLVPGASYLDRAARLEQMPCEARRIWLDYLDPDDPIVDGSLFGAAPRDALSRLTGYARHGVRDIVIDTGGVLSSHVGYWSHPMIAQAISTMALS